MTQVLARRAQRGTKFVVSVEGRPPEKVDPDDGGSIRRVAKRLGATEAEVTAALLQAAHPPAEATIRPTFAVETWSTGRQPVTVTGTTPWETLRTALAGEREFYRWRSRTELCVLDVDVRKQEHGFTDDDIERIVTTCPGPLPAAWWRSRSNGIHYVFEADRDGAGYGLTAEQKGGVFALLARGLRDPRVEQVELLANTRRIPGGHKVTIGSRRYGVEDLVGRLKGTGGADAAEPHEIDQWLQAHGLEIGRRYTHEHCPFEPGPNSRGDPVSVTEEGVHCFRCAGVSGRGSARWAKLVRHSGHTRNSDPLAHAAAKRVHFTHADLMIQAAVGRINPVVRRVAYEALLNLYHDEDTAKACMAWGSTAGIVRGEGGWIYWPGGGPAPVTHTTTRDMPWARGTGEGIEKAAKALKEELDGYMPIRPTRCLSDTVAFTDERESVIAAPLLDPQDAPLHPAEVPTLATAQAWFYEACPGLTERHWTALRVAVLAGMRAQLAPPTPSFLLIDGPPGSGKGFMVRLAAGVLGSLPASVRIGDADEVSRSIGEGCQRGAAIAFVDEVGKVTGLWHGSSPLLELTDTVSWRALYLGPTACRLTSAIVFAGSTLPHGLTTMREFDRRCVRVRLPEVPLTVSEAWERSFVAFFGTTGEKVMTTPKGRAWAEALREWARDELGGDKDLPGWRSHACDLGAERLEDDEEAVAQRAVIRDLYDLWRTGPESIVVSEGRHKGWLKGWTDGAPNPVASLIASWWENDSEGGHHVLAEKLSTASAAFLGVPVKLVVQQRGKRLYLRFLNTTGAASLARKDAAIYPPAARSE